jgi:hypothetical protein
VKLTWLVSSLPNRCFPILLPMRAGNQRPTLKWLECFHLRSAVIACYFESAGQPAQCRRHPLETQATVLRSANAKMKMHIVRSKLFQTAKLQTAQLGRHFFNWTLV